MPATKEGLERLLEFFVYGMLRASESLGNAPLFVRAVEEAGLRKFLLDRFGRPCRITLTRTLWRNA